MEKFEFDLEEAVNELKQVNDLLCTYQEFFEHECPTKGARGEDAKLSAQIFADRSYQFRSLIYAAQDKITAMHKEMETAIENHYHGENQKGGEAA